LSESFWIMNHSKTESKIKLESFLLEFSINTAFGPQTLVLECEISWST
jgi:hypothetical protein